MRVLLKIELLDSPRQLINALEPISSFGGNITSVVHDRVKKTAKNTLPVQVTFDIDPSKLDLLINELNSSKIRIVEVNKKVYSIQTKVILIGHVLHTDITETIDMIETENSAHVVELHISMPEWDKPSSAIFTLWAYGIKELNQALKHLKEIAGRKDLQMISPIDLEEPP